MNCTYNNKDYLDPFFEAFFSRANENVGYLPMKTDIYESDKSYRLDMELPGLEKDNISIDLKDGTLTVAVKSPKNAVEGFKRIRRERFYGETSRQFYLGEVDEKSIDATYRDGVLSITANKVIPEEPKPLKIEIH